MKNRLFAIISILLLLCTLVSFPVYAIDLDPDTPVDPEEPDAPFVDISYCNAGCSINSNGLALASSYAQTAHTSNEIYISISLERYKDGYWQHYAGSWSNSGTGYCTSYKYYYVVPGYYYRTSAMITVLTSSGSYVEGVAIHSPYHYY